VSPAVGRRSITGKKDSDSDRHDEHLPTHHGPISSLRQPHFQPAVGTFNGRPNSFPPHPQTPRGLISFSSEDSSHPLHVAPGGQSVSTQQLFRQLLMSPRPRTDDCGQLLLRVSETNLAHYSVKAARFRDISENAHCSVRFTEDFST
jgi:hypothetical protein